MDLQVCGSSPGSRKRLWGHTAHIPEPGPHGCSGFGCHGDGHKKETGVVVEAKQDTDGKILCGKTRLRLKIQISRSISSQGYLPSSLFQVI